MKSRAKDSGEFMFVQKRKLGVITSCIFSFDSPPLL